MAGQLYHVVDTSGFDRDLLDELCDITTRVRSIAKTIEGALALQALLPHARAMLYFPQPSNLLGRHRDLAGGDQCAL